MAIEERLEKLDDVERSLKETLFFWLGQVKRASTKDELAIARQRVADTKRRIRQAKAHRIELNAMA